MSSGKWRLFCLGFNDLGKNRLYVAGLWAGIQSVRDGIPKILLGFEITFMSLILKNKAQTLSHDFHLLLCPFIS